MPKLIVQDGDAKRAFRLSKGRLTLGSADSNKLVLTSDGVAGEHAVLTIREEAASIDALAPVEIDGEKVSGEGNAVPIGATIKIGGAAIALRADDDAGSGATAGATKGGGSARGGSSRGGRSGGSSRAGSGSRRSGGGGSARGGRAGGRSRRDDDEERPSRRRPAKSGGRPAWLMPVVILFAVLIVAIGIMMSKGSGNETALNQAIAEFEAGQYDRAENWIGQVKRASLPPGRYQDYDDIAERIELQQKQSEIEAPRARAAKWADQFLIRFVDSYLSESKIAEEAENGRQAYTAAKMRTWFERLDELGDQYPDWDSPAWRVSQNWANKADQINGIREDFAAKVDPNAKMTDSDLEWALFYYTDPSARKGNRFDKALAALEQYKADGGSGIKADEAETLIMERADAYADYFLGLARDTYKVANEQSGDTINRQHLTSVNHLLLVARYSALPERANEALDLLERYPKQEDIWKSYVKAANSGDDAAYEKITYLEQARPYFRSFIEEAREELAAADASAES